MGQYVGQYQKNEMEIIRKATPNSADYITVHANMSGLAVVEIERLWYRFEQLGADKDGNIPATSLYRGELVSDPFTRMIIKHLPKEKDGSLSFTAFCRFVSWLEMASDDEKIKAIFTLISDGNDVDKLGLEKLLAEVYPTYTRDQIRSASDLAFTNLDPRDTGKITELSFLSNIRRLYPDSHVSPLLFFDTIPADVVRNVNSENSIPDLRN